MRWLAIAAAVAVLVAGGALVVRARHDDSSDVASTSGELETGWLVPPDGWTIASVMVAPQPVGGDVACPCTMWAAARPGQDGAVFFLSEGGAVDSGARDRTPVDVGGRPGRAGQVGGSWLLWAESRGREVLLSARGVEVADLAVVADAVLDQRDAGESLDFTSVPLPEGFVGTRSATKPAWQVDHTLIITAQETATGRYLTYMVAPPDYQRGHLLTPGPVRVEGGVITTTVTDNASDVGLVVVGGPEDLVIDGPSLAGPPTDSTFTEDELRRFAAGLREVATADWRAALAPAVAEGAVDGNVLAADSLTSPPLTGG